jgi:hypothetical protein
MLGVITVFRAVTGKPQRDDLDLTTLYAGYAAGAIERDRLLEQVTARNRVLETIREVLQTLAGPVAVAKGLIVALDALRDGLSADELALVTIRADAPGGVAVTRAYSGPTGTIPPATLATAESALAAGEDGRARPGVMDSAGRALSVAFTAPQGHTVLLACWRGAHPAQPGLASASTLVEDAAHSLQLALERERLPSGGDGAAPVPGDAARVLAATQPRAADAAHGDHRVCLQPAPEGRDLGR